MLCEEIMKCGVAYVSPDDPAGFAARRMLNENIGFLPICDGSMRVLGTLTDRDIAIRLVAEDRPASTPVKEIMTQEVVACWPTDDVRRAEQLMGRYHKSRIVCLDDEGCLVGVISLSDIAQREDNHRIAKTMREVTRRETHGC